MTTSLIEILGDSILEPQFRDARWFIYLARTAAGVLEIRSKKKLTGKELKQRVLSRLRPRKKAS